VTNLVKLRRGIFSTSRTVKREITVTYKIERLGLGGILDQAIAITKNHFGLLFSIMLMLVVPYYLVAGLVQMSITPTLPPDATTEDVMAAQREMMTYMPWLVLLGALYLIIVLPIANGAIIQAVARVYLGQEVTAVEAIKHGLRRVLPLIGTSILMTVIIMLGFLLFIIPGIYFTIWYGLGQHVVVLEGQSGMAALRRSKALVHPQRGTFLALLIIVGAINWAIGFGAAMIPQPIVSVITTALAQGVGTIFWTAALVVYYFSARCVVDNFDLHYLAESISAADAEENTDFSPAR
jgi:hypothetical protein